MLPLESMTEHSLPAHLTLALQQQIYQFQCWLPSRPILNTAPPCAKKPVLLLLALTTEQCCGMTGIYIKNATMHLQQACASSYAVYGWAMGTWPQLQTPASPSSLCCSLCLQTPAGKALLQEGEERRPGGSG